MNGIFGLIKPRKKRDARRAKESVKKPIEHKKPRAVVFLHGMESFMVQRRILKQKRDHRIA